MVADNPALKRGGDGSIRATKRDELAARAMERLIGATQPDMWDENTSAPMATAVARIAYLVANAMLAEGGRQR